jgi:hypothetical protein
MAQVISKEKTERKYKAIQTKKDNLLLIKTLLSSGKIDIDKAMSLTVMCQNSPSLDDQEHLHWLLLNY